MYCKACAACYVQPMGEGREQDPLPNEQEEVNLVQEGQRADEIVLDIVTRSKSRLKTLNEAKTKPKTDKIYKKPHLVPSRKSPPERKGGHTGVSERARRYEKRCRNLGIPRYLSDAPDPEVSVPDTVKLLEAGKEEDLPDDVPRGTSRQEVKDSEKSYERLTRGLLERPGSDPDETDDDVSENYGIVGLKALDCLTIEDWVIEQAKDPILRRLKEWICQYPVKTMVKHYVDSAQNTWDRFLHYLRMAYNFTEHKSTKCTPFRLFFLVGVQNQLYL